MEGDIAIQCSAATWAEHDRDAARDKLTAAEAENAALRKALAVVVAKADSHPAVEFGYIGGTLVEVYLPFSPGELDVMRRAVG